MLSRETAREFYRPGDDPFATVMERLRGPRFVTNIDGDEFDDPRPPTAYAPALDDFIREKFGPPFEEWPLDELRACLAAETRPGWQEYFRDIIAERENSR